MRIMKKVAPIALALGLTARALFGNPLETTIVKEENKTEMVDFRGNADNKSFSLDLSLPVGDEWNLNFASDVNFSDMEYSGPPKINNLDLVLGRENFYFGASYEDLSTETMLNGSNIFKFQWGMKPADWINFSVTGARIDIPNNNVDITSIVSTPFSAPVVYNTPLTLYAGGWNLNIGKEFSLNPSLSLFPWLSTTGSLYLADPQVTDDLQVVNTIFPGDISSLMASPFQHVRIVGGLDLKTEYLDLKYKGTYEGQPIFPFPPIFNFTNMLGLRMHDGDKMDLEYDVILITKPPFSFDQIIAPTRNELQFDITGFYLLDSGLFFKAEASALVDFLTQTQFSATAAVGWKFKDGGNIEAYFSSQHDPQGSQNNIFGLQYSTKFLDKSTSRESKTRNNFDNSTRSNPTIDMANSANLAALHTQFGNTLEEAVKNVHNEQDISRLMSFIQYKDHPDGAFTAQQEYEQTGWGDCEDTNGNLGVVLEKALNIYKNVWAVGLRGVYGHGAIVMETQDNKFQVRSFEKYFDTNAPSAEAAIQDVFPGAFIYDDGTVSTSVQTVRDAVERPLYDWTKFRKD